MDMQYEAEKEIINDDLPKQNKIKPPLDAPNRSGHIKSEAIEKPKPKPGNTIWAAPPDDYKNIGYSKPNSETAWFI